MEICGLPEGTKSIVLVVDDPDAQRVVGYTWIHWVVFDIPVKGDSLIIEEDSIPGKAGESTYKKREYGGPNPPVGTGIHNYHFSVYALDCFLDLEEMSSLDLIEEKMQGHVLDSYDLVGIYSRD